MNNKFKVLVLLLVTILFHGCYSETSVESTTEVSNKADNTELGFNSSEEVENSGGKLYVSKKGQFSVMFPGEPEVNESDIDTKIGKIKTMDFIYEESLEKAYMISYSDYPNEIIENSLSQDLLLGAKNGAINSLGIKNLYDESAIELQGFAGIYFKGVSPDNYFVTYCMYMRNTRLYQIAILQENEFPSNQDVANFFNSFEFLE